MMEDNNKKLQELALVMQKKQILLSMSNSQKTKEDVFKFMYPNLKIEEHEDLLGCFEHLLVDTTNCVNEKKLAYDLEFQTLINSYAENPNQ